MLKHSTKLQKIILLVSSTFLSLVFIEGLLHFINYPQHGCKIIPLKEEKKLFRFDTELGWSFVPNKSTVVDEIVYSFNEEGYRAENRSDQTDFSKPVILVVGDSMLLGQGLSFKDTFGYKLQKRLLLVNSLFVFCR